MGIAHRVTKTAPGSPHRDRSPVNLIAGREPRQFLEPPFHTVTKSEILQLIRDVATRMGKRSLTRDEFAREAGVSISEVYRHDNWRELCELAGLAANRQNVRVSENELFSAMRDRFNELGGIASRRLFAVSRLPS